MHELKKKLNKVHFYDFFVYFAAAKIANFERKPRKKLVIKKICSA